MSVFFAIIAGKHPCKDCYIEKLEKINSVRICAPCRAEEKERKRKLDEMPLEDFIKEVVNGRECLEDSSTHYYSLYEKYSEDMPYGTAKARDGDPYEWIFERLYYDYDHLIEEEEVIS